MKERPILFSAPMVIALREDRKTNTRRTSGLDAINESPDAFRLMEDTHHNGRFLFRNGDTPEGAVVVRCPYGVAGDRLWVREALIYSPEHDNFYYVADRHGCGDAVRKFLGQRPERRPTVTAMFMPRIASRDTLEVVSARPERLQDITEEDAIAEGCESCEVTSADVANFQISDHAPQLKELSRKLGAGSFTAKLDFMMLWDDIKGAGAWTKNPWVWRVEFSRVKS